MNINMIVKSFGKEINHYKIIKINNKYLNN